MQAEMNKLFAEGGVMQEGGTVDPVSGNDVPPGAMKEEVRDDIDAKLSEGEFVIPADVVRYIGLETLMKLRDKAKMGLQKMEEIGQMGNASEVPDGEALHGSEDDGMDDETFSSEIDSILSEDDGEDRGYAGGGYVVPDNAKLYRDAPIKGFEMVPMTNDEGQTIYIPYINGVAQLSVPAGYRVRKTDEVAKVDDKTKTDATTTTTTTDNSGGSGDSAGTTTGGTTGNGLNSGISISPEGLATANSVNASVAGIVGNVIGAITGIPGLGFVASSIANTANFNAAQDAMNVNVAVSDTTNAANNEGVTSAAATAGTGGTGGAAAAAASAAASAAAAAGHSDAAIGAASQAAADATVGGATAAAAAAAAADAANAAAADAADADGGGLGGISGVDAGAGANAGVAGGGNAAGGAGNSGDGGTGDSGSAGGGIGAGDGGGGIGAGEGLAKGGFVSKRKDKKTGKSTSFVTRQK